MKLNISLSRILLAATIIAAALAASCSMEQEIYIDRSGAGEVSLEISLADYLTTVVDQLQSLSETENPQPADAPFFNVDAIAEDFAKMDGVNLTTLVSPDRNSLSGSFEFDDVNTLYGKLDEDSAESRFLSLETNGDINELKVSITRETVNALLAENPSFNNPLVESFGPAANEGLGEEDYLSMMEFALGEESRQGILESSMVLTVNVEGRIVDQQGGVQTGPASVEYTVPLLPVLLLSSDLEYSLRYR